MKTSTIQIYHKDPDGWGDLINELGLSEAKTSKYFEFCEYATVELEIDEKLNIVGGKILPVR